MINKEDILNDMQPRADKTSNFREWLVFSLFQIKYKIIKEDSPKNNGFPIVLHCINVGIVRKVSIRILFFNLFDKNKTINGKLII